MAFSIKNEQADHLVRQVSMLTGESLTDAVIVSLQERLERLRSRPEVIDRRRLLDQIVQDFAMHEREHRQRLGLGENAVIEDPLQWDENGLPV